MAKEITMPKLSDTMEEGRVLRWLKREGDRVERGEPIAEVETDKAEMEMEAFDAGVLLAITVGEGETATVGDVIGYVGQPGEEIAGKGAATKATIGRGKVADAESAGAPGRRGGPGRSAAEPKAAETGNGARARSAEPPPRESTAVATSSGGRTRAAHHPADMPAVAPTRENAQVAGPHADIADVIEPDVEEEAEGEEGSSTQAPAGEPLPGRRARPTRGLNDRLPFRSHQELRAARLRISPLARRLAREAGLDPAALQGTGPDGRVVRADVERALGEPGVSRPGQGAGAVPLRERPASTRREAAAPSGARVPVAGGELGAVIPHSRIRRVVAQRMAESKRTVPHFYTTAAVRMERALELKAALDVRYPDARVSITHLIVKGSALALERYPRVSGVFEEDKIRIPAAIHIGLAVALEDGLLVPVVRDCARKSLPEIAREAHAATERARGGKLAQDDLQGAVFSVSNLGMFPIEQFAAIITPPQSAILAVGGTADEPVVEGGKVVPGKVMRLTLSADHRVIDGVLAAAFLSEIKRLLEAPLALVV
jgi:pyruvate dehydrogenase E2 component (dihydrolipoamide acetyltransferase)